MTLVGAILESDYNRIRSWPGVSTATSWRFSDCLIWPVKIDINTWHFRAMRAACSEDDVGVGSRRLVSWLAGSPGDDREHINIDHASLMVRH